MWWWCPPPNDTKLHSDPVLVLQPPMGPHVLFSCHTGCLSAAKRSLQLSLELPPWSRFSNQWMCVYMRAWRVVLYLGESDCPLRVQPSLWLNNALCICDQVIYMRCDRTPPCRPPGHHQSARDPASAHFPWALCTALPPLLIPESGSLPTKFSSYCLWCYRSVCRSFKHQKLLSWKWYRKVIERLKAAQNRKMEVNGNC